MLENLLLILIVAVGSFLGNFTWFILRKAAVAAYKRKLARDHAQMEMDLDSFMSTTGYYGSPAQRKAAVNTYRGRALNEELE
jgi:hypothetical protein